MDLSAQGVTTAEQVADLLDVVSEANGRIAAEVDRIVGSRAAVSQGTVDRLTYLADELRPGAAARTQLSALDPSLLLAGTSVWLKRRRRRKDSAAARAQTRWAG